MQSTMQKTIMRRVYYSYALSIVTSTVFWQGVFLGVATLLLADWLHVASIISNFLSVPVGQAPQYLVNSFVGAIASGKVLAATMLLAAGGVALSVVYQLIVELTRRGRTSTLIHS
jgi:hypothetical protein